MESSIQFLSEITKNKVSKLNSVINDTLAVFHEIYSLSKKIFEIKQGPATFLLRDSYRCVLKCKASSMV
jgi:hypothetical protein